MTGLIRLNVVLALVFAAGAVGVPAYYRHVYPDPPPLQKHSEFQRNVESITDIEHLRKVLYAVVAGTDKVVVASKQTTDASIHLLSVMLVLATAGFAGSAVWLYILKRKVA